MTHHFWVDQMKQKDGRLVLSSEREFGQSFMFTTAPDQQGHGNRDVNIPNRYWFDLPPNWATQVGKDPIIGIGEIYRTGAIRHVKYHFTLELRDVIEGDVIHPYTISFTGHTFLRRDDNLSKFVNDFVWEWSEAYKAKNVELLAAGLTPYKGYDIMIESLMYVEVDGVIVPQIKFDTLDGHWYPEGTPTRWQNVKLTSSVSGEVEPKLTLRLLNDDALRLFHSTTVGVSDVFVGNYAIIIYPKWDHNPMYIKSSISSLTNDSYLGHTVSTSIARIRYFKLPADARRIWIELYSARDHRVASVLPDDEQDSVMIEGVVYFDATFA